MELRALRCVFLLAACTRLAWAAKAFINCVRCSASSSMAQLGPRFKPAPLNPPALFSTSQGVRLHRILESFVTEVQIHRCRIEPRVAQNLLDLNQATLTAPQQKRRT